MNLLAAATYDPATVGGVSKATSSLLAMTAVDTANLRLAVTVPAHGIVRFRLRCAVTGATTPPVVLLGVLSGATVIGRVSPMYSPVTAPATTQTFTLDAEFTATGLTPGAANFDAAYAVQVIVASTNIKYGGANTNAGANAWGGFVFEAWDPRPLSTNAQLVIDANGGVDVRTWRGGAIPAPNVTGVPIVDDKYLLGTIYSTPATAGIQDVNLKNMNNVSASPITTIKAVQGLSTADTIATYTGNTPQTGDAFARIGAAGAGLTALGDARIANLDAAVSSRSTVAAIWAAVADSAGVTTLLARLTAIRAGNLDNLDAAVSTRSTYAGGAVAAVTAGVTVTTNNDKTGYALTAAYDPAKTASQAGDAMTLTAGERTSIAAAVWGAVTRTLSAFGFTVDTNPNATETAIKGKTDSLTFTKAGEIDANTKSVNGATVKGDGTLGNEWGPL